MENEIGKLNPFYDTLDSLGPFGDSRDLETELTLQGDLAQQLSNRMIDAGQSRMPPLGNIVDINRLQKLTRGLQDAATPDEARKIPQAGYTPGYYADIVTINFPLAVGQEATVLTRPRNTRVLLVIVNPNIANLYVAFDQIATVASGLLIPPNGNLFFDQAVPQNDIHVIYGAAAAVNVQIFYINTDLTQSSL